MLRLPKSLIVFVYICLSGAVTTVVHKQSFNDSLSQLEARASVRLEQYNDRLLGQVSRFQQLVYTLSRNPDLTAFVAGQTAHDLSGLLLSFGLSSGADSVFVMDRNGTVTGSSDYVDINDPGRVGQTLSSNHYVKRALDGGLGLSHGLEGPGRLRTLYLSRAIFGPDGRVIGAIGVAVSFRTLEFEWTFGPDPVIYYDQTGVGFISNRPDLAFLRDETHAFETSRPPQYDSGPFQAGFTRTHARTTNHDLWHISGTAELPETALILEKYLPRLQMKGVIFQDVSTAEERALLFTSLSALALSMLGMMLWLAWRRRQDLAVQLLEEAAANERLEAQVDRRTAELRDTQRQLIAASRLTALGEMSAGISHELNQPLGAIRQYAENGQKYLARNRPDEAASNFARQIEQVDRIGRIIKSLRAFARNEEQDIRPTDLKATIEAALALSELRLKKNAIRVDIQGIDAPVIAMAGQVRLQQVIVNILSNAIEALEGHRQKVIQVEVRTKGKRAIIHITDNGPGIASPDKVFDPFYSTKSVGSSSGMGLGLSISHGIIESFGGRLTCENHKEGGAQFHIDLPLATEET